MIRTTITMPEETFLELKAMAFYQKTTVSLLVREGIAKIVDLLPEKKIGGFANLIGKYEIKSKQAKFERSMFYEKLLRQKMSA